jgi:surface polysaccharide O-acyltransferase-like enzyme
LPGTSEVLLRASFPSTNNFTYDWANHSTYFLYFLIGFFLASNEGYAQNITKYRKIWLMIATALVVILYIFYWIPDGYELKALQRVFYRLLNVANAWAWLLTIFGFGYRYLNFNNHFLQYANKAVFPFYILHQTITIALVYYMLDWNAVVVVKFLIAVVGTFGISFLWYEFIIRRIRFLHPFFGLKWEKKESPPPIIASTQEVASIQGVLK